ncbi:MAG TPA: methyltransferase domain-containing protein [Burkholderiales bacterium]|nr:methyltransferase domain-containing protein [Burkholderiales bacterium]
MRAAAWALLALAVLARAEDAEPPPPFITTPNDVVERMLRLAGTTAADTVVDLGSGDGRIVIAAARQFGARGIGIELNGELVAKSRENARRAGVAERVSFVEGDVLTADISRASVVTVYLLPSLLGKLQPRFVYELAPGTRIVSHAFSMAGWRPDRVEHMAVSEPHPRQGDDSTLYVWVVPAEARGTWRGGDWRLRIYQSYQELDIDGTRDNDPIPFSAARMDGRRVTWRAGNALFRGEVDGERMRGELEEGGARRPLELQRSR